LQHKERQLKSQSEVQSKNQMTAKGIDSSKTTVTIMTKATVVL
jgi:hypothetical protein